MKANEYIISGGKEGKSRLDVLSDVLRPSTRSLLESQGLAAGMSFLDVGCGGGNVSLMAAKIVGETGKVVGVDFDEEILSLAQQEATEAGIKHLSYVVRPADELNYSNEYDIAYARFLLSHLRHPLDVLSRMADSVKAGGRVVVEDIHFSGHLCYPACLAFEQYVQFFKQAAVHNGQNADIGPSLFGMFQQVGLKEAGVEVLLPCFNKGPGKWMAYLTLDRIKDALIKQGIADATTVDSMLTELKSFTEDEQTIMSMPHIFRVWGRK